MLDVLKLLIPYKNIIASGDYLIATSENYFRDNSGIISFKYGGKLTTVGYITNTVYGENEDAFKSDISPLATIQPMINRAITMLFNAQKTMHVVHPIAIYYE